MKEMLNTPKKQRLYTAAALAVLLAALGLLLWRSLYSFCWSDESFYIAMVHRFWLGDAPLRDEWNTAQLYSVLLLPFYSLYRAVVGSAQGVYLAARIFAVLLTFAVAFGCWWVMKKEYPLAGLCAALMVLFYAKANLAGPSYYTLCFAFFFGGLLILYSRWNSRGEKWTVLDGLFFAAAGILLALAVVCMPFAAVLWLAVVPALFLKKLRVFRLPALCMAGGAALAAAVYLAFLLGRASLDEILLNMPWVLSDPDSNTVSFPMLVIKFFAQPFYQLKAGLICWAPALAVTLWVKLRRRPVNGPLWARLLGMAVLGFALNLMSCGGMLGRAHLAVCLLGVQCWLLCPAEARPNKELAFFGVTGLAFAFVWQVGSNTGFSGMTLGFVAAMPFAAACVESFFAAVEMPEDDIPESAAVKAQRRNARILLAVLLLAPVLASGWQRVALVYRDAPLKECTVLLEEGPAKGLYTNPTSARQYHDLYTVLQEDSADGPVFVSALAPWAYLCTDRPVGAPTTWRIYADSTVLQGYYEVHPNRRPETVLILADEMGAYVSTIQPEDNPAPNTPAQEGFLLEELAQNYAAKETPAGTLYRLKG